MKRLLAVCVSACGACLTAWTCAAAGGEPDLSPSAIKARVERAMPEERSFWGGIVVAKSGDAVVERGFGRMRPADAQSPLIDGRSLFDIGSVTKPLVATAIVLLAQESRLSLDDAIEKYAPEGTAPKEPTGITIRHLLSHTSGRDPAMGIRPYDEPSMEAAWTAFFDAPELTKPGEKWNYHNGAYCILAAIIERASGVPYDDFMRERVMKPMGMTNSGFAPQAHMDKQRATARGSGGATALDHPWGWGARGCTGVVTCLDDLRAWDRAIAVHTLLPAVDLDAMHAARFPARGATAYGLGWFVDTSPAGTPRVWHSGGTFGYRAELRRYPAEGLMIAVLTSDAYDPRAVADKLERALFGSEAACYRLTMNFEGLNVNEHGLAKVEAPVAFARAEPSSAMRYTLKIVRDPDQHPLGTLDLPAESAKRLLTELDAALAGAQFGEPAKPPSVSLVKRWADLAGEGRLCVDDGAQVAIEPRYAGRDMEGRSVIDQRPMLVVRDTRRRIWPLMVIMDEAACDSLRAAILDKAVMPEPVK